MDCIFCHLESKLYLAENGSFFLIRDKYPVSRGHLLVVSKRHYVDFFEMDEEELVDFWEMTLKAKAWLEEHYSPDAYNLGMNCGREAGQSVSHFHMHIIPRYKGEKKARKDLREFVRELL